MLLCLDARTVEDHFPGIGRYTFNLARSLAPQLGDEERLLVLRDPRRPSHWDVAALAGQRVEAIDTAVSPFSLRQQWQLPRLLRARRPSIYHSPYYLMPVRPGVATVVTIHDLLPLRQPQWFTPAQRLIFGVTIRLALRAARLVIAVSASTAGDLRQRLRLPPERIAVIPEAADPSCRPQPRAAVDALRSRLGLPERYVLCVGSNKPHKNLVRLVEAWGQLQVAATALVIAGPWDDRYPEARRRAGALASGRAVRFLGMVAEADLPALYSGATVVVCPSEYEGFGLPLIEAMACGAPVACADTSGLREVAGQAARLFDPSEVAAIAQALQALLTDAARRDDLRARGLARAAAFSWEHTAGATLAAYRQALR